MLEHPGQVARGRRDAGLGLDVDDVLDVYSEVASDYEIAAAVDQVLPPLEPYEPPDRDELEELRQLMEELRPRRSEKRGMRGSR